MHCKIKEGNVKCGSIAYKLLVDNDFLPNEHRLFKGKDYLCHQNQHRTYITDRYMPDASYDSLLDFSRGLIYMTQAGGTALLWTRSADDHRLQRRAAWLITYLLMLSTFNFYVYFIDNFLGTEMRPVVDPLQATAVPVFLFLLVELTAPHRLTRWMMAANYLPYLLAVCAYSKTANHTLYNIFLALIAAHCCGILIYGFIAVKRYNRRLLMTCSNTEHLNLRWLRFIFYLFVAIFVVWLFSTLLPSALHSSPSMRWPNAPASTPAAASAETSFRSMVVHRENTGRNDKMANHNGHCDDPQSNSLMNKKCPGDTHVCPGLYSNHGKIVNGQRMLSVNWLL